MGTTRGPWVETETALGELYPFRVRVEARKNRARIQCIGIEHLEGDWRSEWQTIVGVHTLNQDELGELAITIADVVIDWAEKQ
jgi:hypothetical protein